MGLLRQLDEGAYNFGGGFRQGRNVFQCEVRRVHLRANSFHAPTMVSRIASVCSAGVLADALLAMSANTQAFGGGSSEIPISFRSLSAATSTVWCNAFIPNVAFAPRLRRSEFTSPKTGSAMWRVAQRETRDFAPASREALSSAATPRRVAARGDHVSRSG